MRILLVSHYYAEHGGGAEIVAGELARRLASQGYEVIWAASAPVVDCLESKVARLPMRTWNCAEEWLGVPYPLWGPISLLRLWRYVRQVDLVHVHDSIYIGSMMAYIYARLLRRPVIVTQHIGMVPYAHRVLRVLLVMANHVLGRIILGGCDRCVFISEKVQRHFLEFVRFRHAPVYIANGVESSVFQHIDREKKLDLRRKLGWPAGKPVMLFVGRFVEKKGLALLRQLAARFADIEWVFVGWGPINPGNWKLPNVRCLGFVHHHETAACYEAADLLVLPSVGEGFPLVVQEAMACGTPVLISRDTAEALPGIENVAFVSDLDKNLIVSALRCILDSPGYMEYRGKLGVEFARRHWDWDMCVRDYKQIFTSVLRDRPLESHRSDCL